MRDTLRLGLVQMHSSPSRGENLGVVEEYITRARDCELLLFPEYVFCLGDGKTLHAAALPVEEWHDLLGPLAARSRLCLVFGGVPVCGGEEGKLRNACLVYGSDGSPLARYDKMHLFRLRAENAFSPDETKMFTHGDKPARASLNDWDCALSVCYDLRFPELYRLLAPFDLLLAPSAFAAATGKAHWELLLRARAVENLCFAAAAAQCGTNAGTGAACYGHSLLVAPWGEVLFDADGEEGVFTFRLERRQIEEARERLPALADRRIR